MAPNRSLLAEGREDVVGEAVSVELGSGQVEFREVHHGQISPVARSWESRARVFGVCQIGEDHHTFRDALRLQDQADRERPRPAALAGTVEHAKRHAAAGADIIVAQGYEAGGHTGEVATIVLVPDVVDAVAPIPMLAAGGIGTGRQIAASLALGAQVIQSRAGSAVFRLGGAVLGLIAGRWG